MKKIVFAFALATLFLAAGCSNNSAYSEEEKKTQDSADEARQEDAFDALMNQDSGTSAADSTGNKQ